MTPTVLYHGEDIPVAKLVRHYRAMSHRQPAKAGFWRTLCRSVIQLYREQVMAASMAEAA